MSHFKFHKTWVFGKKSTCQRLLKALDISSVGVWVAPDLLKALAIVSGTTLGQSADGKYLKLNRKSEKLLISWSDQKAYF